METAAALPPQPALLEREAEIAAIQSLVAAARGGAGRLLVVEGRAGMGKTRLVGVARAAAQAAGLEVLAARAGELEQEFAFGVVRQLFEPLLARASAEERAELTAGAAGLALPLFRQPNAAGQEATDTSFAMLHGLYWLAANLAMRRPALLAIDDLHWADVASLRWIAYLARRLEGLPLLVAVAARPPEQGLQAALLTEVLADPAAVVVRPGALG
jgi:predicted ATPase